MAENTFELKLDEYFGKCDWCNKPTNEKWAIMIQGLCFNVCPECGQMIKEKVNAKEQKDQATKKMLQGLYEIGHPKNEPKSVSERIRAALGF